jgi:hypothetical protein
LGGHAQGGTARTDVRDRGVVERHSPVVPARPRESVGGHRASADRACATANERETQPQPSADASRANGAPGRTGRCARARTATHRLRVSRLSPLARNHACSNGWEIRWMRRR